MNSVAVRHEVPADINAVAQLITESFKKPDTAVFVARVRREVTVCLSLVAEDASTIVGHVVFATVPLTIDGRTVRAAYLACAAVGTALHKQGIGGRLIRDGLSQLRADGFEAVLVLGHPTYYPRFGFSSELAQKIRAPFSGKAFMALELTDGALAGISGEATFHPLYTDGD